jgi:virginiamycin A acetyltransferase
MLKSLVKSLLNVIALAMTWPCSFMCYLERIGNPNREGVYCFWAQCFALLPGTPGMYLRRAFYRLPLDGCAPDCFLGFGVLFSTRRAVVESQAYVGTYALIGSVILRRTCLIGSRVSLLSGGQLHVMDAQGNWLPTDLSRRQQIEIGENAWIGEGAVVMADIGPRAMVSAGAVVSTAIPPSVMVAGNPARFVKRLAPPTEEPAAAEPSGARDQHPIAAS